MSDQDLLVKLDEALMSDIAVRLKTNPTSTIAIFKNEKNYLEYIEVICWNNLKRHISLAGQSQMLMVTCIDGEHVFLGPKSEKLYVIDIGLTSYSNCMLLFNKSFTIREIAFRRNPNTNFTIMSGGTITMDSIKEAEKHIALYGPQYAFAAKFVNLAKPNKLRYDILKEADFAKEFPFQPPQFAIVPLNDAPAQTASPAPAATSSSQAVPPKAPAPKPASAPTGGTVDVTLLRKKYLGKTDEELKALMGHNYASDLIKAAKMMNNPVGNAMDVFNWPKEKKIDLLAYLEIVTNKTPEVETPKAAASSNIFNPFDGPSSSASSAGRSDIGLRRVKYLNKSDDELIALIKNNFGADIFDAATMMGSPVGHARDTYAWPKEKKADLLAYLEIVTKK